MSWLSGLLVLVFFGLAAFRSDRFPDYIEYSNIFYAVSHADLFSDDFFGVHGEIGFKIIIKLLSMFWGSPLSLMIFFSILSYVLLLRICKIANLSLPAVWLVYYSNAFLLKDLAQIRNAVASLLIVQGIVYAATGAGRIKSWSSVAIACTGFQYFSLAALVVFWVKSRLLLFFISIAAVFLFVFLDLGLLLRLFGGGGYLDQYDGTVYVDPASYNPWLAIIRSSLFLLACLYLTRKSVDPLTRIMLVSVTLAVICYLAFAGIPILSQRLGGYFLSVDAFICALLLRSGKRPQATIFLIAYAFFTFYFNVSTRDFLLDGYHSIL